MRILLPIVLVLLGLGLGVGAGMALRPSVEPEDVMKKDQADGEKEVVVDEIGYVKINNQFVVPIINEDKVSALVVLSLSLEAPASETAFIYEREPKLRDAFLQVMFDHAYIGGFNGVYTASPAMDALRSSLLESARLVAGESISDILITDIVRQDI
ncbi:MAG: flagellar basal body-associated FliL family protein [Litoreibacter sp.]|uniref:flagellar basal body-associated FliL family protein n=1 Tax=Litoreibacter sp. TaxID=1969459 RepID=UPI00329850B0